MPHNPSAEEWAVIEQDTPQFTPDILARRIAAGHLLPWVKAIADMTTPPQDILDLGAGTGHVSAALAMKGCHPTLMDFSSENLAFSRQMFQCMDRSACYVHGDITEQLPFADGSFHTSVCCSVLQFFDDEQIHRLFAEAFRVARHRVIFTAPNARCIFYRLGKRHLVKTGRWHWGTERHFRSLRPYMSKDVKHRFQEFSVGPAHAMEFLAMRGAKLLRRIAKLIGVRDRPSATMLRQGYMLMAVLDKT